MDMANHPVAADEQDFLFEDLPTIFDSVPDPDPSWATSNPNRAFAFFYVSPRPCAALELLLA